MADNCVCAQPGEYHLRSDHRHNGDDCLVAYDERCSCKKFRLGERVDVAAENARLRARVEELERNRHPWYGGCDGFADDGGCGECERMVQMRVSGDKMVENLRNERDHYKAPAERRKEALVRLVTAKDALDDPCGTCDLGIPGGECHCAEKINELREAWLEARATIEEEAPR